MRSRSLWVCLLFTLATGTAAAQKSDWDALSTDSLRFWAEKGRRVAQYKLGLRYEMGSGVEADKAQAFHWIEKSAAQGYGPAMGELGAMYDLGDDVPKNADSALKYMQLAAAEHDVLSELNYSLAILDGKAGPVDSVLAYSYATRAAWGGSDMVGVTSRELAEKLSPAQRAIGDSMATAFLVELLARRKGTSDTTDVIYHLAKGGVAEYQLRYGKMLFFKGATDTLMAEGTGWIRKAAEQNYPPALCLLGQHYSEARGVIASDDSALSMFTLAANMGDAEAQAELGAMYEYGHATKPSAKEALRLYKLSAAQNNDQGILNLGSFYWSDHAPKKNKVRAYALLSVAHDRFMDVDFEVQGDAMRKMNDKEKVESEALHQDLADPAKIKSIIDGWVD